MRDIDTSKAAGIDILSERFLQNGADVLAKPVIDIYQSGLRNTHSTDLFVSFPNNKILKGFDSGVYADMTLTDLQKAFDRIKIWYHKILLDKPVPIGFSKNTVSWYQSY